MAMRVTVANLSGYTVELDIEETDTLSSLVFKIADVFAVPTTQVGLAHGPRRFTPEDLQSRLRSLGVESGSCLTLIQHGLGLLREDMPPTARVVADERANYVDPVTGKVVVGKVTYVDPAMAGSRPPPSSAVPSFRSIPAQTSKKSKRAKAPSPPRSYAARRSDEHISHKNESGSSVGALVLAGVVFVLVISVAVWFGFGSYEVTAVLADATWERSITPERSELTEHEGWAPPCTPYQYRNWQRGDDVKWVESQGQRIHHYEPIYEDQWTVEHYTEQVVSGQQQRCHTAQVYSHTDVLQFADGTSEHRPVYKDEQVCTMEPTYESVPRTRNMRTSVQVGSDPIYREYYRWAVYEWHRLRTVIASGRRSDGGNGPYWPDVHLGRWERANIRSEQYSLMFEESGGRRLYTQHVDERQWRKAGIGDHFRLRLSVFGNLQGYDLLSEEA
mmetsp:Transcript_89993/g.178885  ORF Transcript_89993/g.178885 Transcript_89993/m.178885 type:complete len:445 (+) Transcript_89993:63-1397(+)